jgi:hypothetical protein
LDHLDSVLRRGAAQRLPSAGISLFEARDYQEEARQRFPMMFAGEERFASPGVLASELFPLLDRCASAWKARCSVEGRASTAFRSTLAIKSSGASAPPISIRETSWSGDTGPETALLPEKLEPATPGSAVFQPDGKVLVRFGDRVFYVAGDRPLRVAVPAVHHETVAASRWLARGPGGGFAFVGPRHVLLVRGSGFTRMPLPERAGDDVGEIHAVIGGGGVFSVVTAETEDGDGGPELWTSSDGAAWAPPIVLPLGGVVRAVSHGPYGFLVVGERRREHGARGRALFLPFDGHPSVFVSGVNDGPELLVAQCGAAGAGWSAGAGFALEFQRGAVAREAVEVDDAPVAMGLDLVGAPWIITEWAALRREVESGTSRWRVIYKRERGRPPLVAIGFTPEEARILDARGGMIHVRM